MRFGIIGTGRIAGRFVPECQSVPDAEIAAVYNPHEGSAGSFTSRIWQEEGSEKPAALSDITALWDKVDAVYIASPHETHYEYIMQALDKGKHVLCEKPMVLNQGQAVTAFDRASNDGLILTEGLKTAFCPGYKRVKDIAESGVIGDIRYVDACFTKLEDKARRELTDAAYGGSFTELGSYVLLPALELLGTVYEGIAFESITDDRGIDLFTKTSISYGKAMATLTCGLGVKSEGRLLIGGTKGYIRVEAPWWKTERIEVHFENPSDMVEYNESFEGDGLRYEIDQLVKRIPGNKDVSISMAGIMEMFLGKRGSEK
ncbi:MAG: Gfo/Idh/MocA family oxidoreductase [Lachnospiraceae bacterium]|nr:Gfo/Idh/MocA family oxidoreductase [Lachnospiraceae bacterium]